MSAIPSLPADLIDSPQNGESRPSQEEISVDHLNGESNGHPVSTSPSSPSQKRKRATSSTSNQHFTILEQPIENPRPIRVIVIGAGISGIYAGIRIPERIPKVSLTIYEKNAGVGGTWHENKYPGCACDIPSHSYQYSFAPNTQWSALYASSKEIEAYLVDVATKYHADRFMKLSHEVEECTWLTQESKWSLRIRDHRQGTTFHDTANVLISARGGLNNLAWPSIPGLDSFSGKVMHSARWDEAYDCREKRVGIIGNGSSGIQILPKVQELAGTHVTSFARSPTWISPAFGTRDIFDKVGIKGTEISKAVRKAFADDPSVYHRFRVEVEEDQCKVHEATLLGTPMQVGGQKYFDEHMRKRLALKPSILKTLKPSFPPGCRRLTPGPGYLEALTKDNVDFVSTDIEAIEPFGVRTVDGQLHELDTLICATGFHTDFKPPFEVYGQHGKTLREHWATYPRSYLSLATDAFPNLFFILGPNAAIGAGSLTMMIESEVDYSVKCIRKLQKENISSMTVRPERVDDFVEYCDEYFKRTVYSTECKSWYKNKQKRVSGLWPGATLHCIEAMRSPRWEDYEYEYAPDEQQGRRRNQLDWLGNGWSINMLEGHDTAWYIYPEFLEVPEERPELHKRNAVRMFSH